MNPQVLLSPVFQLSTSPASLLPAAAVLAQPNFLYPLALSQSLVGVTDSELSYQTWLVETGHLQWVFVAYRQVVVFPESR